MLNFKTTELFNLVDFIETKWDYGYSCSQIHQVPMKRGRAHFISPLKMVKPIIKNKL